jgi:alpha-ribazole phosphatase
MAIHLIRHTATDAAAGTVVGRTDVGCASTFASELGVLLQVLPAAVAHIATSPARRCRLLAAELVLRFGVPVVVDERMQELDFGTWEGRTWDAIPAAELDPWMADFVHQRAGAGESFAELMARARAVLETELHASGERLLVTHAGFVRACLVVALDLPVARVHDVRIDLGSVTTLQASNGRWLLQRCNRGGDW